MTCGFKLKGKQFRSHAKVARAARIHREVEKEIQETVQVHRSKVLYYGIALRSDSMSKLALTARVSKSDETGCFLAVLQ